MLTSSFTQLHALLPIAAVASQDEVLIKVTLVVGVASGAQVLAAYFRLPSIVVLLAAGLTIGPFTGLVNPDQLLGDLLFPFVTLAVGIILFEGGLLLNFRELRGGSATTVVPRLLIVGVLVTWIGGAVAARLILGVEREIAALLSAILVVSGPTVVLPLMRFIRPQGEVTSILKFEGIFNDPIGAVLAVFVFEAIIEGQGAPTVGQAAGGIGISAVVGTGIGLAAAGVLYALLRGFWLPVTLHAGTVIAVVAAAVTSSDLLRAESGLFAAVVMGVVLANQQSVPVKKIAEFKETLGVVLTSLLFVVLSARIELGDLSSVLGAREALFVVVLILLIRPLAVLFSTLGSSTSWAERGFLAWMHPRGIVAAAVSSLFGLRLAEEGVAGAEILAPVTFLVIFVTAAVYGLTGGPMAKRLKIAADNPQGVLIVGGARVGRQLGLALKRLDFDVVVASSIPAEQMALERAGLEVYDGNVLHEHENEDLDLTRLARALIISDSDEWNCLAATQLMETFGRHAVWQIATAEEEGPTEAEARGRPMFGEGVTYDLLERKLVQGERTKLVKLSEDQAEELREEDDHDVLPLFLRSLEGELMVVTGDEFDDYEQGERMITLTAEPVPTV
ncbi:MAG: cation:proton antiporter [Solirubrobacterales bacterium]